MNEEMRENGGGGESKRRSRRVSGEGSADGRPSERRRQVLRIRSRLSCRSLRFKLR